MALRHPVYVISKGRHDRCLTGERLLAEGLDFLVAVEPPEAERYAATFGRERLLVLPFQDLGQGALPVRNFVWEHAVAAGAGSHWVLDDNIRTTYRRENARRVPCSWGEALGACEEFVGRYENVALASMRHAGFVFDGTAVPPFKLNQMVYCAILIRNDLPFRWRLPFGQDVDLSLQALVAGWCTVVFSAYLIAKVSSGSMGGGNASMYAGDGRLRRARLLARTWPGLIDVGHRWGRAQHVINGVWGKFDAQLRPRRA